ncbi:hypothetical protein U1Q18_028741 [Sarracenia purpurea var. burkii]
METLTIKPEKIVVIDDDIPPPGGGGGGGGGGGFYVEKMEVKVIEVKEGPMIFLDEDCGCGGGGIGGGGGDGGGFDGSLPSSSATVVPKPMEGLHEAAPPPFLRKTFQMVEDPETDEIISWSLSQKSFVVWDHHQWEFANEGFQGGKKHLLKNIRRRKQISQNLQQQGPMRPWLDSAQLGIDSELEKLRNDKNKLKMEILKLKQQQDSTENHLASVEKRMENTECKQQQIFVFLAKAFANPVFLHRFIRLLRQKRELCHGQIEKKRRLTAPQSNRSLVDLTNDQTPANEGRNRNQEELTTIQSEVQTLFSGSLDDEGSPNQEVKANNGTPGSISPDLSSENYILWEKLLEDELICENDDDVQVEAELAQNQSMIVLELENLIAKSPDWTGYVMEL